MAKDQISDTKQSDRERAADRLFLTLMEMIEQGQLKEGDALPPEREIVATYGVSRTVAREAVQALANRGLVDARPRFRPVVKRPSYENALETVGDVIARLLQGESGVRNLFEARMLVEGALVRKAASRATPAEVSKLARALHANKSAVNDSPQFYHTDQAFHRILYEITQNPVLLATHKAFVDWLSPHWVQMPPATERNQANYEAHAAIFDAIQDGDADRAEDTLNAHLEEAWDQVRGTFNKL
ncbi:MAG: FCD domain-containing protein [Pseudomonadota bacterium]